jgi:hypothetical protein
VNVHSTPPLGPFDALDKLSQALPVNGNPNVSLL